MKLDYNKANETFVLRVPRARRDIDAFMNEHGLDLSAPASTAETAVFFTKEPYAALPFAEKFGTTRAKEVLAAMQKEYDASWAKAGTGHYPVPYGLELWPFQVADLDYCRTRSNILVGDQPGLGKTQVAIALANERQARRILVIVPAAIRGQWVKRIREWTTMKFPYHVHLIRSSKDGTHPNAQWTVVSYELARSEAIGRALAKDHYDLLILDEGHYLKSIDARRTRAVFGGGENPLFDPLSSRADNVLALTGTPLPNRPREAYTLARGLNWDAIDYMSEDHFRERFNPSRKIEKWDEAEHRVKVFTDERTGRHAELQARMRVNFMSRHLKRGPDGVMDQLKLPKFDIIELDETDAAVRQALAAERLLDIDPENLEGADVATFGGAIATVRQQMGVAMAPLVCDYLDMLIDGGEKKLVVFAWHTEVLDILEARLSKYGLVRYRPGQGASNEQKKNRFLKDPAVDFIIGNVLTLGTGTDGLQDVAWHALLAEPDWVHGQNEQCFDRLDRGGQRRTVQGDIFVIPGSFAERVLAKALRKGQIAEKALDRRIA
jgi:SNF2 family DNA or RNA helicase